MKQEAENDEVVNLIKNEFDCKIDKITILTKP